MTPQYLLQEISHFMFYRRKFILALIEQFGGKLHRTDLIKHLFLICQNQKSKYYDFFPYQYGSFSFMVYQDKNQLIRQGLLRDNEDFELNTGQSFYKLLKAYDQVALKSYHHTFKHLSGKQLIRHAYLCHPYYACRSTIIPKVVNEDELEGIRVWWNNDDSPRLFSIGYEGKTIDEYLNTLITNNVKVLVDVRKNPLSMKYGFSKTKLKNYVERAGLKYIHIPQLGIPSELRKNLNSLDAYGKLFEYYQSDILPPATEAIAYLQTLIRNHRRIALTCFEADYHCCHRHKITEHLNNLPQFEISIQHI